MRHAVISVHARPWTGWSREQPAPRRLKFTAQPGQTITPELLEWPFGQCALHVGGINALGIQLTYEGLVIENSGGTVDLSGPRTGSVILTVGKSLRLSTATMDAGTSFDVTLDAIE